jgi:multisubunit Na+/H+ antiporter MnhC subunit
MTVYLLCLILFGLGLYCILRKRNIIKMILGVVITQYAVSLFFVLLSYQHLSNMSGNAKGSVDPVPQAVVLTSIVVGLALVIVLIALALRIYEKYGTFDITQIRDLRE